MKKTDKKQKQKMHVKRVNAKKKKIKKKMLCHLPIHLRDKKDTTGAVHKG